MHGLAFLMMCYLRCLALDLDKVMQHPPSKLFLVNESVAFQLLITSLTCTNLINSVMVYYSSIAPLEVVCEWPL